MLSIFLESAGFICTERNDNITQFWCCYICCIWKNDFGRIACCGNTLKRFICDVARILLSRLKKYSYYHFKLKLVFRKSTSKPKLRLLSRWLLLLFIYHTSFNLILGESSFCLLRLNYPNCVTFWRPSHQSKLIPMDSRSLDLARQTTLRVERSVLILTIIPTFLNVGTFKSAMWLLFITTNHVGSRGPLRYLYSVSYEQEIRGVSKLRRGHGEGHRVSC